jgi:hypothetical protein
MKFYKINGLCPIDRRVSVLARQILPMRAARLAARG